MEEDEERETAIKALNVYLDSRPYPVNYADGELYQMLLRIILKDKTLAVDQCTLISNHSAMFLPTASYIHKYKLYGITNRKPLVKQIIVKLRNDDPNGSRFRIGMLFENEMKAYSTHLKVLQEMSTDPLPIPQLYYARRATIVMECLGDTYFEQMRKPNKGIIHEQLEPILRALAKFHSCSLLCKFKMPSKFINIEEDLMEVLFYYKPSNILDYMEMFFEKLHEMFKLKKSPEESEELSKVLLIIKNTFPKKLKALIRDIQDHAVFCHGDLRACNIFIKRSENTAKFIDFQQMCHSSVARDLVTLFYVNLHSHELHNCTKDYQKIYLDHLHTLLKEQEIDMESTLTEEWLDGEIKRFQFYGIVYGLWHSVEFYINNKGEQLDLDKISRKKCGYEEFNNDYYERAKSMLLYFLKQVPDFVEVSEEEERIEKEIERQKEEERKKKENARKVQNKTAAGSSNFKI